MNHWIRIPRVARSSQPWAERHYPVGVIPIPAASPEKQKAVARLVDRILAAKQRDAEADTSALEREIASRPRKVFPQMLTVALATGGDELVYALYGLTPEEKALVQAAAK